MKKYGSTFTSSVWMLSAILCPMICIGEDNCDNDESRDLDEMESWYKGDDDLLKEIIDDGDEGCSTADAVMEK
ncbi:MAG: hypothetical protein JXR76_32760 [Deltaproteobacteria bacterium]|nr:hypothetical protein [Deltaproteobacteria bacterium]